MHDSLIALGVLFIAGLVVSRLAKTCKLPNVTAFLVAGLLIGPSVLGLVSKEQVEKFSIISNAALGFIAFSIGSEFKFSNLKSIGIKPIIITIFQGMAATLLVNVGLILLGFDVPMSLMLGAIALATAPAATLMVVKQYKAKGPLTRILLPVVAMDDALALMVFSISAAIAQGILGGNITVSSMLFVPLYEIFGSLIVGALIGFFLTFVQGFFKSRGNKLSLAIASVLIGVGISTITGFSSLLVCMMIGAVLVNTSADQEVILEQTDRFTPPIYMMFFILSGAELDLAVLPSVGLLGILYIVLRSLGKWGGALMGASVVKAEHNVRKYLGLTLLPQAGVAIGMSKIVSSSFPTFGAQVTAVVLAATLVYELIGPVITKIALIKAGEIKVSG